MAHTDPDEALVLALKRGDPSAAEMLVDTHANRVYRVGLRITGSHSAAEDALQEALLTVLRTIGRFEGDLAFGRWLDRIGARVAYQRLPSHEERAIGLEDVLPELEADGRHWKPMDDWSWRVDEPAMQKELSAVLEEAIAALPPDHRAVIILHDHEGLSSLDIAGALGLSLSAVKSLLHRSRLCLRQRLAAWMQTVSGDGER